MLFLLLFLSLMVNMTVSGAITVWSSQVQANIPYHWQVEKENFNGTERFNQSWLAGSFSINEGDISITITEGDDESSLGETSTPNLKVKVQHPIYQRTALPEDFDFFSGDRLKLSIVVEGDQVIDANSDQAKFHSDWHLFILPIQVNGQNFFEKLFNHVFLLENMTHGTLIGTSINSGLAIAQFRFDDNLNVTYEWNTTNGFLSEKKVVDDRGGLLRIIPGEGKMFDGDAESTHGFTFVFIVITATIITFLSKKKKI